MAHARGRRRAGSTYCEHLGQLARVVYRVDDVGGEQQVEPLRRSQSSARGRPGARLGARLGALARATLRLGCQLRRLDALLRAVLLARHGARGLIVPVQERDARAPRPVVRARAALHRAQQHRQAVRGDALGAQDRCRERRQPQAAAQLQHPAALHLQLPRLADEPARQEQGARPHTPARASLGVRALLHSHVHRHRALEEFKGAPAWVAVVSAARIEPPPRVLGALREKLCGAGGRHNSPRSLLHSTPRFASATPPSAAVLPGERERARARASALCPARACRAPDAGVEGVYTQRRSPREVTQYAIV